jgi:hypothetical protein
MDIKTYAVHQMNIIRKYPGPERIEKRRLLIDELERLGHERIIAIIMLSEIVFDDILTNNKAL